MTIRTADEVRTTTGDADVDVAIGGRRWLRGCPDEASDSHKGSCGYALVIAGSVNYTGRRICRCRRLPSWAPGS